MTGVQTCALPIWMGHAMDGSLRMLGLGVFGAAVFTTGVAWTLVRRHGQPSA